MSRSTAGAFALGVMTFAALACGSPPPPATPVDVAVGSGGAGSSEACTDPTLPAAPERERGIDAFLADRPQEAVELLSGALKKDPNDRAAEAFRKGAAAKLEEGRARATDAPAAPRIALQPIPLVRTERRPVEGVPSAKVHLEKESEKKNQITDDADWETKNGLRPIVRHGAHDLPAHVAPALGSEPLRTAFIHADHAVGFYGSTLMVTADGRGSLAIELTEALSRAPRPFEVMFAQLVGSTLVIELAYNGYAKESGGKNGYLVAYDAKTGEFLWVSEPLTGNVREALVSGGSIVTGYGFTAEPDFVFVLDLATGKTEQKIPVKSGPELMRLKGDRLFVRTYDTDYVFKSTTGFAPALPPAFPNSAGPASTTAAPPPKIDTETRCWVRRATAAILAGDAAGIHEASERLKPLSRDRTLDDVLRDAEQKAEAR